MVLANGYHMQGRQPHCIEGPKDRLVFASTHKENQEVHSG